jgi:hypothetical protein
MEKTVRVAVSLNDGSVAVLYFCTSGRSPTLPHGAEWADAKSGRWIREATDANIAAEVMKTFHGDGIAEPVSWRHMPDDPPQEREFRDSWEDDGTEIRHDMTKARSIFMVWLRRDRNKRLEALDRDWMRAVGRGESNSANSIEAQRQILRDLPAAVQSQVDQAQSVEELCRVLKP